METVETTAGPETTSGLRCALDDLLDKGRVEGRVEEARWILERLLQQRFGALPAEVTVRLRDAPLPQLERWTDRVLTASSAEALVDLP